MTVLPVTQRDSSEAVSSPTLKVTENSGLTPIGIAASDPNDPIASLLAVIGSLPSNGAIYLADGVTQVTVGEALTGLQLTNLEFRPTVNLFEQSSTLAYTLSDAAGNATDGAATLEVGPNPPSAPTLGKVPGAPGAADSAQSTNLTNPLLSGTALPFATVRLYDGAAQVGIGQANQQGVWSITSSALATGTHTITATETDAWGIVSAASGATQVTVAPTTTSFNYADNFLVLQIGNQNDTIKAGNGNDVIIAGTGSNSITLGNGQNYVLAADVAGHAVNVTLGKGSNTVVVGDGNDKVTLNDISGAAGQIVVGYGTDTVAVGAGNDTITLGNGTDKVTLGTTAAASIGTNRSGAGEWPLFIETAARSWSHQGPESAQSGSP